MPAGTAALGNTYAGIFLGCLGTVTDGMIGGSQASDRNIVSGNGYVGIFNFAANLNIQGNYVGTDVTGASAIANGTGIRMDDGFNGDCSFQSCNLDFSAIHDDVIGGMAAGEGNLISGNSLGGINFASCEKSCAIEGNEIGTTASGDGSLGNGYRGGIWAHTWCPCRGGADQINLTIGGTGAGSGNLGCTQQRRRRPDRSRSWLLHV